MPAKALASELKKTKQRVKFKPAFERMGELKFSSKYA